MDVSMNILSQMLSEAFDCGYTSKDEERNEIITDLLARYKINEDDDKVPVPPKTIDDEFRLYHVSEILHLPVGTIFIHSTLGKCSIHKRHGQKYMSFDNVGLAPAGFNVDGYPWNVPLKRII